MEKKEPLSADIPKRSSESGQRHPTWKVAIHPTKYHILLSYITDLLIVFKREETHHLCDGQHDGTGWFATLLRSENLVGFTHVTKITKL